MKNKKTYLLILCIFVLILLVSCTTKFGLNTSNGKNLVEKDNEILYTVKVSNKIASITDSVKDIIGLTFLTENGDETINKELENEFKTESVAEENVLVVLSLYESILTKIEVIEEEKQELYNEYFRNSIITDARKIEYLEKSSLIKQKYYTTEMFTEYNNAIVKTISAIGVEKLSNIIYNSLICMLDEITNSDKAIFTPDIYYYFENKQDFFESSKMVLNAFGKDSFLALFSVTMSIIPSLITENYENYNASLFYNFYSKNDVKKILDIVVDKIEPLILNTTIWEEFFHLVNDILPSVNETDNKILQIIDTDFYEFAGENTSDFIQNISNTLKNIDESSLEELLKSFRIENDQYYVQDKKVSYSEYHNEFIKKEFSLYKILGNFSIDELLYYDGFIKKFLVVTEKKCMDKNVIIPDGYYDNLDDVNYIELINVLEEMSNVDLEKITNDNLDYYVKKTDICKMYMKSYFKSFAPMSIYYLYGEGSNL